MLRKEREPRDANFLFKQICNFRLSLSSSFLKGSMRGVGCPGSCAARFYKKSFFFLSSSSFLRREREKKVEAEGAGLILLPLSTALSGRHLRRTLWDFCSVLSLSDKKFFASFVSSSIHVRSSAWQSFPYFFRVSLSESCQRGHKQVYGPLILAPAYPAELCEEKSAKSTDRKSMGRRERALKPMEKEEATPRERKNRLRERSEKSHESGRREGRQFCPLSAKDEGKRKAESASLSCSSSFQGSAWHAVIYLSRGVRGNEGFLSLLQTNLSKTPAVVTGARLERRSRPPRGQREDNPQSIVLFFRLVRFFLSHPQETNVR